MQLLASQRPTWRADETMDAQGQPRPALGLRIPRDRRSAAAS